MVWLKIYINKIRLSSAGERLLIIRIDKQDDFENGDEFSEVRVWQLNDRNPVHHWREFENDSNLSKNYPYYAVNFPPVIEGI